MTYKQSKYNLSFIFNSKQYIFNTFSNGLSSFDDSTYNSILKDSPEDTPYLNNLIKEGFVVPKNVDELNKLFVERLTYQFSRNRNVQFLIVPSLMCNLKCVYCYQRDISANHYILTDELINKSIRFIEKTVESNQFAEKLKLNWFGGEPLLHFDIIKRFTEHFIAYCSKRGIEYSANMTTNGLLLTENISDYMFQHGLKTLQVTIDGTEDYYIQYKKGRPGDLDKLIENIRYASNYFDINVRFNTSRENCNSVMIIADYLAKELNMKKIQLYPAKIYGCEGVDGLTCMTDDEFSTFSSHFNKLFNNYHFDVEYSRVSARLSYCGSMRRDYAIIGPDGYLYRCEHQIGKETERIGDVEYGFYRNEADMKFLCMPYADECKNCSLLPYCFGGCPSDRICDHKKFDCDSFREKMVQWVIKTYLSKSTEDIAR